MQEFRAGKSPRGSRESTAMIGLRRMRFAGSQMQKPHPENRRAPHLAQLEYPEAWAKIRVRGTILVLATREGGKDGFRAPSCPTLSHYRRR